MPDPLTLLAIGSALLGGLGGFFGGGSQPGNRPFGPIPVGGRDVSPEDILGHALELLTSLEPALLDRVREGVSVPGATAQALPVFAGGGLPMPIGVTGRDPALDDPSLLSLPGLDIPSIAALGAGSGERVTPVGPTGNRGDPTAMEDEGDVPITPEEIAAAQGFERTSALLPDTSVGGPQARSQPSRRDLRRAERGGNTGGPSLADQAVGAINLLLLSRQGGGNQTSFGA